MRVLYHVTPAANLPAIRRHGLVPAIGPRSALAGETEPYVYLFPDPYALVDAASSWLLDLFDDDEPLALCEVHVPEELEARLGRQDASGFELLCPVPIPPGYLTFHRLDEVLACTPDERRPK